MKTDLSITSGDGFLSISGVITGDNFPSTESFITDPKGNSVFLVVGFYKGSPFTSLRGDNNRDISIFDLKVSTDKNGNFTGVNFAGKDYNLDK